MASVYVQKVNVNVQQHHVLVNLEVSASAKRENVIVLVVLHLRPPVPRPKAKPVTVRRAECANVKRESASVRLVAVEYRSLLVWSILINYNYNPLIHSELTSYFACLS